MFGVPVKSEFKSAEEYREKMIITEKY